MPGRMKKDVITNFILGHFPLAKKRNIKDDDHLLEAGIVDSLGVLELVTFLERGFKITVLDDELTPENFKSIDSLVSFVWRKNSSGR